MKITLNSILVNDQQKALDFYTRILGFVKKADIDMGQYKWLTVTAPDNPDVELVLEPMAFPPAKVYQTALFNAGIPATSFEVDDIEAEHLRLADLGVKFKMQPTNMGMVIIASFEDTCGNYIQMHQPVMRR